MASILRIAICTFLLSSLAACSVTTPAFVTVASAEGSGGAAREPAPEPGGAGGRKSGGADKGDLAKAAQNPVADLMSLPLQNNTTFRYGTLDKTQSVTNIQPVVPIKLSEDWMVISRTIAPLTYQPPIVEGDGDTFGLGDVTATLFLSPRTQGELIWGVGPALLFPTATDERLGAQKWGAGPAGVALTMQGPWVVGALAQNIWSFADASGGSDRADVNQLLVQPFVNYNLPDGWYAVSAPIITANWDVGHAERWTVPLGGGVGRLFKVGKLPVNLSVQGYWNVVTPDTAGGAWLLRIQLQFLFPAP